MAEELTECACGCGAGFLPRKGGKPQKYASSNCRRAHQHSAEKAARAQLHRKSRRQRFIPYVKKCAHRGCEVLLLPADDGRYLCSSHQEAA